MRWFRSHKRRHSWLALFALALQLALSFGHIHPEDFAPTRHAGSAAIAAQLSGGGDSVPAIPNHRHNGLGHDDCAICATVHLVASAALSAPPALPLPNVVSRTWLPNGRSYDIATALHAPFRARAPPLA